MSILVKCRGCGTLLQIGPLDERLTSGAPILCPECQNAFKGQPGANTDVARDFPVQLGDLSESSIEVDVSIPFGRPRKD